MRKPEILRYRVTGRWLRAELTTLRTQLGWSRRKVANKAGFSLRTIERIENGPTPVISAANLSLLCDVYGVTAERRAALNDMRDQARKVGWWDEYRDVISPWQAEHCEMEDLAETVTALAGAFIPGTLQTPAYTQQLHAFHASREAEGSVPRLMQLRVERKHRFFNGRRHMRLLLDGITLNRCFTQTTRQEQIEHILDLEDQGHLTVRVLPLTLMPYPGIGGNGEIFNMAHRTALCVEALGEESHSETQSTGVLQNNFRIMWESASPIREMREP